MYFLSKKTGIKKAQLRKLRTLRDKIEVKHIILPYIQFTTAPFQKLLEKFKEAVIFPNETKGGFKYSVNYKGVKTDFGLGGVHGARETKVYESNEDMIIMTSDVVSFYPNLAIRNKWAPAHLPKQEFCELYEWFFEERKKIPKKDPKNYVYKIILNSTYGLSNDENSFLYDPQFTMRITINGQLSLTMLYEMICEEIPDAVPLMQNTDGLETMIPRKYEAKYMEICKRWEEMTNLQLEHDKYTKLILGDVNNYIAITEDGKSKCKGRFEFADLALHKNKSFLVVPKALHAYFVEGVEPETYIRNCTDIFDFCGGVKIRGDWKFFQHFVKDGEYTVKELQHTIRYYICKSGSKIIKKNNSDNREIQVEAGKWMQQVLNAHVKLPIDEYEINYDFYIEKVRKEIQSLQPIINQLSLF
jgi:DNA polymerase elongation subunit (family B)